MHSVMFVATIGDQERWDSFLINVQIAARAQGVEKLAENAWLLNLQKDTTPLGLLIYAAVGRDVAYRILAFDDEPQWLPADSSPKTN